MKQPLLRIHRIVNLGEQRAAGKLSPRSDKDQAETEAASVSFLFRFSPLPKLHLRLVEQGCSGSDRLIDQNQDKFIAAQSEK